MTVEIWDGDTLVETRQATPHCGEDFCDRCGDCLACYRGERCEPDCRWVLYTDVHAERIIEIRAVSQPG